MRSRSSFVRRHRRLVASVAAVVVVALGAGLAYFEPWQLWIDDTVDEAAPVGADVVSVAAVADVGPSATAAPSTTVVADGARPSTPASSTTTAVEPARFVSIDHTTTGALVVLRNATGEVFVRFEDLRTDNGPDLKVYLSANPPDGPRGAFDDDAVDLGRLQGNIGSQNYLVPAGTDLSRFRSVVIWCDRFNAPFGAAPLA